MTKILKGHEGEMFWNPLLGDVELYYVEDDVVVLYQNNSHFVVPDNGLNMLGNLVLFPSKDQMSWDIWIEHQGATIPKTWKDFVDSPYYELDELIGHLAQYEDALHKSMFAHFKINKLIGIGYGGNVTNDEWKDVTTKKWVVSFDNNGNLTIKWENNYLYFNIVAFHTQEQANEFVLYPENIELLKDYFMFQK